MTRSCLAISAVLALCLIILALRPAYDLDAARLFYLGDGRFVGDTPAGTVARYVAWGFPFVLMVGLAVWSAAARAGGMSGHRAPSARSLAFLAASLAIAPGLLVHATLKEVSHRPRPYAVTEFGGHARFRPFDRFDGACEHNCAFPSGETAAATWTIAPASLVPPPWRGLALTAAFVFAAATGAWRLAFGAHFLSDVFGAALITILVVLACRSAILGGEETRDSV